MNTKLLAMSVWLAFPFFFVLIDFYFLFGIAYMNWDNSYFTWSSVRIALVHIFTIQNREIQYGSSVIDIYLHVTQKTKESFVLDSLTICGQWKTEKVASNDKLHIKLYASVYSESIMMFFNWCWMFLQCWHLREEEFFLSVFARLLVVTSKFTMR